MTTLKARFDGRVLIPEQPVDLPQNRVLEISIADDALTPNETTTVTNGDASDSSSQNSFLAELADWAEELDSNPNLPTDGAAQHDHYLYRTPKRS